MKRKIPVSLDSELYAYSNSKFGFRINKGRMSYISVTIRIILTMQICYHSKGVRYFGITLFELNIVEIPLIAQVDILEQVLKI